MDVRHRLSRKLSAEELMLLHCGVGEDFFFWGGGRRLLRVPCTEWRSNQSILKEISPECSLEGLKLKLQYFGQLLQRTESFIGKDPDAGKD